MVIFHSYVTVYQRVWWSWIPNIPKKTAADRLSLKPVDYPIWNLLISTPNLMLPAIIPSEKNKWQKYLWNLQAIHLEFLNGCNKWWICIYAWIQADSPTSFHQIQERMDKVAMVCIWGSSHKMGPLFDSVQSVNIIPMSLWFMVL
jgi:hypothetical protein